MIDLSDFQSMQHQSEDYISKIFNAVEKYGGVVARDVYLSPDEAREIATKDESPWIAKYFGAEFTSWDSVCEEARRIASQDNKIKCTDAMRSLANTFRRHMTATRGVARHNLSQETTNIARLKEAIELSNHIDKPVYNSENTAPEVLEHYLGYIYKFSPLNQYCPDLYMKSLLAYGDKRQVNLTDEECDVFGEAVAELQKAFGITKAARTQEPNTLRDTQVRARNQNPSSAHSLPCMTNGKNKEASEEQLVLAEDYKSNYRNHGDVPFVDNRRIQQGGNVLGEYFERLFPMFDKSSEYPTTEMFDQAIKAIAAERPWLEYYCRTAPLPDGYSHISNLPQSESEREAMVAQGLEDECILKKFKDGTWRFNCKVSEPNPWKLISDDEEASAFCSPDYQDLMLSKNRNVFAGSNPVALNKQSFVHKWLDFVREHAPEQCHKHLVASWMEPKQLRIVLTNMVAAIHGLPNAYGKVEEESPYQDSLFAKMSGDDKSGFDNFQAHILHAAFNCCILAPLFTEKHDDLLKHISVETSLVKMMTWNGMYMFSEAMPSGEGATNAQDGFISAACGLTDIALRTGLRPKVIMEEWAKKDTGMVDQGDDYESPDEENVNGDVKQENFSKFGVKLSVPKSLISDRGFEYTRQFSDCNWRVKEKGLDYEFLAMHAPTIHSFVKVNFGENMDNSSKCIAEVSQINRCANVQYHPNFIEYMKYMVDYTAMGMGTKPQWYVPEWNMKAWREAGAPAAPSNFHVWIDSPQALVKVAAEEATRMGESLDSITDKSWAAQFDDTSSFEELRVVKVLNAIQANDSKELDRLKNEIIFEPIMEISRKYRA